MPAQNGEVAAATKHIWWLTYTNESEKRSKQNGREASNDQEVILNYLRSNITQTVFTSRTPPKRDHHGYTRG